MPSKIRCLHLTDFHQGLPGSDQETYWTTIKQRFFADIPRLLQLMEGPIDMILFTGDLTQSGTREQFALFTSTLEEIVDCIACSNRDAYANELSEPGIAEPIVLFVPGNHDLQWLDDRRDAEPYLQYFHDPHDASWRNRFWEDHPYRRKIVNEQFKEYQNWLDGWYRKHRQPAFSRNTPKKLIAGDFAATIRRGAFELYVVGLNSAFLHLARGEYKGKLEVDPCQLRAVVDPDWEKSHHAALLLTHHPIDWLAERSASQFKEHIFDSERFAAHLHGHMHLPSAGREATSPRFWNQGAALFSAEPDPNGNVRRIFGYSAICIEPINQKDGLINIWPRQAKLENEHWRIAPDKTLGLLRNEKLATPAHFQPLRAILPFLPTHSLSNVTPELVDFDTNLYVSHFAKEQELLDCLLGNKTKRSICIEGPPQAGKRSLWNRVKSLFIKNFLEEKQAPVFIEIDINNLSHLNLDSFLFEFAERIIRRLTRDPVEIEKRLLRIKEKQNLKLAVSDLVEDVLKRDHRIVVLELLGAAPLWIHKPLEGARAQLRAWIKSSHDLSGYWQRLRIVILCSTFGRPAMETGSIGSSLLPVLHRVQVPRFNTAQIGELAQKHQIQLSENQCAILYKRTGGHAGLLVATFEDHTRSGQKQLSLSLSNVRTAYSAYIGETKELISESLDKPAVAALRKLMKAKDFKLAAESENDGGRGELLDGLKDLHAHGLAYLDRDEGGEVDYYYLANEIIPLALSE